MTMGNMIVFPFVRLLTAMFLLILKHTYSTLHTYQFPFFPPSHLPSMAGMLCPGAGQGVKSNQAGQVKHSLSATGLSFQSFIFSSLIHTSRDFLVRGRNFHRALGRCSQPTYW